MQTRTVDQVESWPSRPFSGGRDGVRDLARAGFTGVVDAGPWVFVLNGTVVGVFGGELDDVGDGTAYESPDPSLVLLFSMLETGGEERARYYTGKTSIQEVDRTLREGGFTGYVELSENVLSGDYYLVYYGGESMSCAFIGNAQRLKTGEEAFDLAADEVGIYTVTTVDVDVTELPEGNESPPAGQGAVVSDGDTNDVEPDDGDTNDVEPDDGAERATGPAGVDPAPVDTGGAAEPATTADERSSGTARTEHDEPDGHPSSGGSDGAVEQTSEASSTVDDGQADEGAAGEAADTIETSSSSENDDDPAERAEPTGPSLAKDGELDEDSPSSSPTEPSEEQSDTRPTDADEDATPPVAVSGSTTDPTTAAADLEQLRTRIATLERERDSLRETRDELEQKNERLTSRIAELQGQVDELEQQLAEAEFDVEADSQGAGVSTTGGAAGERLDSEEALAGTTVFVRYDSKSGATLDEAHEGGLNRESLSENLYLEHHTTFDHRTVSVEGQPFAAFLEGTMEHRFVTWLLKDLIYEIRETDHARPLGALFDALPEIDRIELHGSVALADREDAPEQAFDVVCRDRLGQPLFVANLRESREPTGRTPLEGLLEGSRAASERHETLAGAFLVTTSYFEAGTLELADDVADDGGLLSSSRKASYVKVDRKHGFHLCLVDGREGRFHVVVPEL